MGQAPRKAKKFENKCSIFGCQYVSYQNGLCKVHHTQRVNLIKTMCLYCGHNDSLEGSPFCRQCLDRVPRQYAHRFR